MGFGSEFAMHAKEDRTVETHERLQTNLKLGSTSVRAR